MTDEVEPNVQSVFTPYCHFSKDSDTLTMYFKDDADYSIRISDRITLYKSLDSCEVIGCRIKGISRIMEDNNGSD